MSIGYNVKIGIGYSLHVSLGERQDRAVTMVTRVL